MVLFLLVTFPGQGHINPSLQFAKRLIRIGVQVTLVTSISVSRQLTKNPAIDGLSFASFSDGYDDGLKKGDDINDFMSQLRCRGSEAVAELVTSNKNAGNPFTCVVYTTLLSWVGAVAREIGIRSVLLWIQPAAMFDLYYFYFNGYGDVIRKNFNDPSWKFEFPCFPPFTGRDLPAFFGDSNVYTFVIPTFKEHIELLKNETKPKVLVNTFDSLEPDFLGAIDKINLIGVGPLIPSAFLDGKYPFDTSFGGDLIPDEKNYVQWLNSQSELSVVYVSFGSYSVLANEQINEIASGLLAIGRPFLWVIRKKEGEEELKFSCMEELEKQGMIVPWCAQMEVLSHPSLGCFVSHCGWNSTMESLVCGVRVVAFPLWTDQTTNAKLIEDVWKTGVRVIANKEGIVEGDEIKRCLNLVMESDRMRKNALKWKDLAIEAAKEGGSSDKNLMDFVDEIGSFNATS